MRLPRMTTRRWMISVATLALISEAIRLLRWREAFLRRVEMYERLGMTLKVMQRSHPDFSDPGFAEYYEAMARKYRQAARTPWLPVEPDPLPME